MSKHDLLSIPVIVNAVTKESEIAASIRMFLKGVVHLTRAERGELFRLYLHRSKYLCQVAYDSKEDQPSYPPANSALDASILLKPKGAWSSMLEKAILTREICEVPDSSHGLPASPRQTRQSLIFVPVVRGESCLGVICLGSSEVAFLKSLNPYDIAFAQALALSLFERQASLEFLTTVQQPIDYLKPLHEFLNDVLLLIAEASKMAFIQIHELEEDKALRCIALYGFGEVEEEMFDLEPLDDFPVYVGAAKFGKPSVRWRIDKSSASDISPRSEMDKVHSLVVAPIRVGTKIFGTLTFGAPFPFDFSPLEVAGLVSLANGVGTAITNSRNAHQLRDVFMADARLGVAISALEVAQAARHEVRGAVDDCVARLAIVKKHLKTPKEHAAELERNMAAFEEHLFNIQLSLDKIKDVSREPDDTIRAMSLVEICNQARALVAAKLALERIDTRIISIGKGKDLCIEVLPDSLRHAFLHLLLNSIDAFKAKRSKSGRLITITLDPQSDAALDVKVRYADNATGIDPSLFKQWTDINPEKDVRSLIFDKGITTKPSGSGFGLYLVRLILQRHHGSIELVDHRGGVVFDIRLPKDLRSRNSD